MDTKGIYQKPERVSTGKPEANWLDPGPGMPYLFGVTRGVAQAEAA